MSDDSSGSAIDAAREELSRIDLAIVALIAARLDQARAIGELKREAGVPMHQPAQEEAVLARVAERAESLGLEGGLAQRVIRVLIEAARKEQLRA